MILTERGSIGRLFLKKQPSPYIFFKGMVVLFHKIVTFPDYIFILKAGE